MTSTKVKAEKSNFQTPPDAIGGFFFFINPYIPSPQKTLVCQGYV